jgi:hypothetical protein
MMKDAPADAVDEFGACFGCPKNMTFVPAKLFPVLLVALLLGPSLRGQEIDLVGNVNWQTFGRGIRIEAERIQNNRDRGVSDFLRLQIWATTNIYDGVSDITGYVLGTFNLGFLDANSSFVNVGRTVRFFRPPPGLYYTTITLEENTTDGFVIVDSENFVNSQDAPDLVNFGGFGEGSAFFEMGNGDVGFVGNVSWLAGNGRVELAADQILNERASGRSGVLRFRLWATSTPYEGVGVLQGYPMATKRVGRVNAGFYLPDFSRVTFFRPPPSGTYSVTMTLEELVRGRWEIVDFVTFAGESIF